MWENSELREEEQTSISGLTFLRPLLKEATQKIYSRRLLRRRTRRRRRRRTKQAAHIHVTQRKLATYKIP